MAGDGGREGCENWKDGKMDTMIKRHSANTPLSN